MINRVQILKAFDSDLADTLVDVIPCWGYIWIICTDKIYLFKYSASGNSKYLAYTFVPASTGELIQCAIGFNGYMYIGTTCPDHLSNARVLRLDVSEDSITDLITDDGTFLTATAELSMCEAGANEHTILGLATCGQTLLALYQVFSVGLWVHRIYRQSDHATWGLVSTITIIGVDWLEQIVPATARSSRWRLLADGTYTFSVASQGSTGIVGYTRKTESGASVVTIGTTVNTAHVNCGLLHNGWQYADNSSLRYASDTTYTTDYRIIDALDLWFANYGSSATLNPAFISDADWYGGITWFGNYFTGLKIVEDDGGGSLTTYYCLAYREPDGNWVIANKILDSVTGAVQLAPKYTTWLEGELVILAPHAGNNNFSIVIPEYTGTVWSKRSGI